jgi:hypothetical protein
MAPGSPSGASVLRGTYHTWQGAGNGPGRTTIRASNNPLNCSGVCRIAHLRQHCDLPDIKSPACTSSSVPQSHLTRQRCRPRQLFATRSIATRLSVMQVHRWAIYWPAHCTAGVMMAVKLQRRAMRPSRAIHTVARAGYERKKTPGLGASRGFGIGPLLSNLDDSRDFFSSPGIERPREY